MGADAGFGPGFDPLAMGLVTGSALAMMAAAESSPALDSGPTRAVPGPALAMEAAETGPDSVPMLLAAGPGDALLTTGTAAATALSPETKPAAAAVEPATGAVAAPVPGPVPMDPVPWAVAPSGPAPRAAGAAPALVKVAAMQAVAQLDLAPALGADQRSAIEVALQQAAD